MATAENPLKIAGASSKDAGSQELVLKESSNEFFFAVVGHAGSGTSVRLHLCKISCDKPLLEQKRSKWKS
jgi:hypothetical protein